MREFNSYLYNAYSYRKSFPGATVNELKHYCLLTLTEDSPDVVIIHVGTNNIKKDNPSQIAEGIFDVVNICKQFGVSSVFVSSITQRRNFQNDINNLNDILWSNELNKEYTYINNGNIEISHIWRDNIHLTDNGTKILANNFIDAINGNNIL